MSIRVVAEPRIYVIGRQEVDATALYKFLQDEGADDYRRGTLDAAEAIVEIAGRTCYNSFKSPRPGGNSAYIGHILESGHGSVIEHAVFTVVIAGVSRNLTHELVRHRVGCSYSQRSQRFVDESDCGFVEPTPIADDPELHRLWLESVSACRVAYERISDALMARFASVSDKTLRRKMAREAARSVLPGAAETTIVVTANVRAWRHFLELRGSSHADAEIRRLAVAVYRVLDREAPALFVDFRIESGPGGDNCLVCTHHKV